jgi:hypothetical protein
MALLSDTIDILLPLNKTKVTICDKPWLTSSIKVLIIKREKALHYYGENPDAYINSGEIKSSILSIKSARFKYYAISVETLKTSNNIPQDVRWKSSRWVVYLPKAVGTINYFLMMFLITKTCLKYLTVS